MRKLKERDLPYYIKYWQFYIQIICEFISILLIYANISVESNCFLRNEPFINVA